MSLLDEVNLEIRPGDDFYGYVNQRWQAANPIPDEKSRNGSFVDLNDLNIDRLSILLAAPISDEEDQKAKVAKQFYQAAMNEAAVEEQDTAPITPILETIAAIDTVQDLHSYISQQHATGHGTVWSLDREIDDKNSERYVARLNQAGLGLPDRDYYFDDSERFSKIRQAYVRFIAGTFNLLGQEADSTARAERVLALEQKMAEFSQTAIEKRDTLANYHIYSRPELTETFPDWDWDAYLNTTGIGGMQELIISQPAFIQGAQKLFASEPLQTWKDYCTIRAISPLMKSLPKRFDELSFSFYGRALSGSEKQESRARRIANMAVAYLAEPAGYVYVQHHFDEAAKAEILDLVGHIQTALHDRIAKLDWMSDETKQRAYEKLQSFIPLLGYPDKWVNYDELHLSDSYCENILAIHKFGWQQDIARFGKPVDRTEWIMSPAMVNAMYLPNTNSITFPAAILQPPFFDATGDFAANYGAIGMVIGHEISHGFDDQGSEFDAVGNMKSWWTSEDRKAFQERAEKLVAQFDEYEVEGRHVQGKLTLGENIGDLAGMLIAYDALQAKLQESGQTQEIDGFTPEQRFFMAEARIWRGNMRPELRLRYLVADPHAPDFLRVNGLVTNVDGFYTAFEVKPSEALYQKPEDRVRIW